MRTNCTTQLLVILLVIFSALFLANCQKSDPVTPEIIQAYQKDADGFCNAMVDCMKEEVKAKMKASPERRDMVVNRMSREFCRKGQYQLIGKLSTDPSAGQALDRHDLYKAYHECSDAVQQASDCEARRSVHKSNPACMKIRSESGY
ncbi:MAG: hypothetical protein K8S54_01995 [Spirochaetia bacterium]|nr:hypothetical protein [Spirochaetia bacterium]